MLKFYAKTLCFLALFCGSIAGAQTYSPLLQPHQNFVDASGNPCAGCLIYSYAAGTTTPQATYTDSTGGTPNPNPIVLDASGSASIWTINLSYKFIGKDALGSTLWTVDNVPGAGSGGGGVTQLIAGTGISLSPSGGTGNVTVNATGSSAPPSLGSLINVTAAPYSALCNGTTDDTTAIQSAITAACGLHTGIYIPAGKSCKVTKSLNASNVNGCTQSFFIEGDPGTGYQNSKIIGDLTEAEPVMDFGGCPSCGVLNLFTEIPTTSMATAFQLFGPGTIGAAGGYGDSCINSTDWLDYPSPANAIGIVSAYDDQGHFINCNVQGSTVAAVVGNGLGNAAGITSKFYTYAPTTGPGETEWHIQDSAFGTLVDGPALQFEGGSQLDFSGENYIVLLTGSTNTGGTFEVHDTGGFTNQINGAYRTENQAGIANACGLNITSGHIGGGSMQASLNGVQYAVCGTGTGNVLNGMDWQIDGYATTAFNFAGDLQNGNIKASRLVVSNFGTFGSVYNYSNMTVGYSTQAQILAGISHSLTPLGWFCGSDGCTPPPPITAFTVPITISTSAGGDNQVQTTDTNTPAHTSLWGTQANGDTVITAPSAGSQALRFIYPGATRDTWNAYPSGTTTSGSSGALNGFYSQFSPLSGSGLTPIDFNCIGYNGASGVTIATRYCLTGGDLDHAITGDQSMVYMSSTPWTSGATNHFLNNQSSTPSYIGGATTFGTSATVTLQNLGGSTQCVESVAGVLTGTGSACGSGGGSGISGLTANYIPLAGSATTITANSHLDDGVTTAGTITSSEPIALGGLAHGLTIPAGTAVSPASGKMVLSSDPTVGNGLLSENGAAASRICTAANAATNTGCQGSGSGTVTNIATTGPITGGPVTTTGTIACPTCVTSAASLTSGALMTGAGSQASQTNTTGTGVLTALGNNVNTTGGFPTAQNCQAITATATATVNWASGSCAVVTANGNNVTVTLSNGVSGFPGGYTLGLCNDGTPRTWTIANTAQLSTPNYPSECFYKIYSYNGTTYEGTGSNVTPSLLYGVERTAPVTSASGAFACWWDSTTHQFTCNENAGAGTSNMVQNLSGATAGQFVQWIGPDGTQHLAAPTGSGTVNSGTTGQVAYYAATGTAVSGESQVTAAQGGTGVANTATITLGTSNVNLATLGTGIVKNTTGTGALTNAAAADVYGLWSGTCSSSTFLRGDGSCQTPGGSGTVTSSGSPVSGNIPKFTTATNIAPAAASDIVALFSTCSGTQYLGADGACHTASGSGTVTSVTGSNGTASSGGTTPNITIARTVRTVTGTDSMSSSDCGELINSTATSSFTETFTTSGISTGCTIKYNNGAAQTSGAIITFSLASGSTFTGLGQGNTRGASSASLYWLAPGNSLDFTYDGTNWNIAGYSTQTLMVYSGDSCLTAVTTPQTIGSSGSSVTCTVATSATAFSGSFSFPAYFFGPNTHVRVIDNYALNTSTPPTIQRTWALGGTTIGQTLALAPSGGYTNGTAAQEFDIEGRAAAGSSVPVAFAPFRYSNIFNDAIISGQTWFASVNTTTALAYTESVQWGSAQASNGIDRVRSVIIWESF